MNGHVQLKQDENFKPKQDIHLQKFLFLDSFSREIGLRVHDLFSVNYILKRLQWLFQWFVRTSLRFYTSCAKR